MLQPLTKRRRRAGTAGRSPLDEGLSITIRFAHPDDAAAVRRLAALDSKPVPPGPVLVAEVAGELWAAVTATGTPRAIADPFRHTAELVAVLHERAERLAGRAQPRPAPHRLPSRPVYE